MGTTETPCPSEDAMNELVATSSIYACVVIQFIEDEDFHPTERLAVNLLRTPYAVVNFYLAPRQIRQLLDLRDGDRMKRNMVDTVVLVILQWCFEHQASFLDFLTDPARSGRFYVDGLQHRMDLARSVLKALAYRPDNPSSSREKTTHVAWYLVAEYFISTPELAWDADVKELFKWLKTMESFPKDFIPLWMTIASSKPANGLHIIAAQSPQLVQILRTIALDLSWDNVGDSLHLL
ncbi:hypothetical protein C8F04DRAFT_1260201 [Mycena alexandri]|uniref:Uncharacterized protein n=1 Tax=Mycena alexandri TaxID=1745969 RepID=A0AAD6X6Q7_9AGAR|nr:hypothetical protein C8F04DRAFT_1260201 [Mycena alexandri]